MTFTISQIAALLGGQVVGDDNTAIFNIAKIEEAEPGCIAFLANMRYESFLYTTRASAVIVSKDFKPKQQVQTTLIYTEDAYAAFTNLLHEYQRLTSMTKVGIEDPVYTGEGTQVGDGVYRGAFSYVGKNCTIGKNVKIYPNAVIGDNVTIGDNTIIYAGVKIAHACVIGQYCTLQAGAVIGSDGFGFAPQANGTYKNIPQMGNVILENHVDIGANTVVDRATLGATVIRKGVKLDNLIQVAHNVEIGEHTVIAAQTGISGSSKIGSYCRIGGQVGIAGHLRIANGTNIAAQSGIGDHITEEGKAWFGSPAFEMRNFLRTYSVFKKLPSLQKRVEELEKLLISLPQK